MAAYHLAKGGASVLLLDRARLPRGKPCGGGITAGVVENLGWDASDLIESRISNIRWLLNHERQTTTVNEHALVMVNRRDFDLRLVEHALEVGPGPVELRDGYEVQSIEEDAGGVTVCGPGGDRVRAKYAIGADGALGKTARSVGLARRTRPGIAIDAEIEVTSELFDLEGSQATLNLACLRYGYGWIFPKAGYLSCGVGSWDPRTRLPPAMDDYIRRSLPAGGVRSEVRTGHPIPLWVGHAPLATSRVCLVGDAGSLVDPILGEGIRFALESGKLAAETVVTLLGDTGDAPAGGTTDCRAYERSVARGIGAFFEALRSFVQPMLLRRPDVFFRKFCEEGRSFAALARSLAVDGAAPLRP
jgi:geranylgeranyl reductase family protein